MNPYLESHWSNVHVLMMSALTAALKKVLPAGLQARPEEEVRVETLAGERLHGFRPDIAVVDATRAEHALRLGSAGGIAVAEPVMVEYVTASVPQRHIEIIDAKSHNRVVTAIEVLSPWNKLPGELNRAYLKKLSAYERGGANWVEIDFLRSSRDHLAITWDDLRPDRQSDYLVAIHRAADLHVECYPIAVFARLPVISIPLRGTDADVPLDLQDVLERVMADGPFDDIDYSEPCKPPLTKQQLESLQSRLKTLSF